MPTIDSIEATFMGCSELKSTFGHSHCLIPISIGKPSFNGSYFKAMMVLINSYFKECTILVCDSLQRYNIEKTFTENIHALAVRKGDEWLNQHEEILKKLSIPYHIERWDKWLKNECYELNRKKMLLIYEENEDYQLAMKASIDEYTQRFSKKNLNIPERKLFENCFNYFIEESTITMLMLSQQGYPYLVYPQKIIAVMEKAHHILVKPTHPNVLRWIPVRLKKKKAVDSDYKDA